MIITITNDRGEKLDIVVSFTDTMDRIIEALYPPALKGNSKGYIQLINHVFGK